MTKTQAITQTAPEWFAAWCRPADLANWSNGTSKKKTAISAVKMNIGGENAAGLVEVFKWI